MRRANTFVRRFVVQELFDGGNHIFRRVIGQSHASLVSLIRVAVGRILQQSLLDGFPLIGRPNNI
jgi:hypothetical protein